MKQNCEEGVQRHILQKYIPNREFAENSSTETCALCSLYLMTFCGFWLGQAWKELTLPLTEGKSTAAFPKQWDFQPLG